MAIYARQVGMGHNEHSSLEALEEEAKYRQVEAQRAWCNLLDAQIAQEQPWAKILHSASRSGVALDTMRTTFKVSPPTWSRWLSGGASPSRPLRMRLSEELKGLAKKFSAMVGEK